MKEKMSKSHQSGVFENVIWKLGERLSTQLVSIVVSIVLARLLSPEDYGIISIVMIFIVLSEAFVTSGLGNSLIQKKEADNLDFSSLFWVGLFLSCLVYAILFVFAGYIAKFYNEPSLKYIIYVMGLRLPLAAFNSIQHAYLAKKMEFKKFFLVGLIGTGISGIIGITMALRGWKSWSLVAQYMTSSIMQTFLLFLVVEWKPQFVFSIKRVKNILPFGLKMMGVSLLDAGFNEMRSIVISAQYSPVDLAMYENGRKYPNLIANNVNASIGAVMFPAMSNQQDNRENIYSLMKRSINVSMFFMVPILLGFMAVAERFVTVVLTEKWEECIPYIHITCVMCLFYPIHTVNIQALNSIGQSGKTLFLEVIKKIGSIVILIVTMSKGVIWIAMGAMILSLLTTFINGVYSKKYFDYTVLAQLKDSLRTIIAGVIMFFIVKNVDCILALNGVVCLFVDIVVGLFVYVILAYILKIVAMKTMVQKFKSFLKRRYDCA